MKTRMLLFSAFLLGCAASAQTNEELMNILKKETEAYANKDIDAWKSYWCHSDNAFFSYTDQKNVVSCKGWPAIEKAFTAALGEGPKFDPNLRRENVKVEKQDNLVYITYDQYDKLNADGLEVHKEESRVMKKTADGWRILSTEVVNMTSFDRAGKELHHILLATFKPEATGSDIQYIYDKFVSVKKDVPDMTSCTMLKNADPSSPIQYTFVMTFRTEEALNQYNSHASHKAALDKWMLVGEKVTVIDSWQ